MDKTLLKDAMSLFGDLGKITSKSMFGGFGIFANDVMFALYIKEKLHIRLTPEIMSVFSGYELKPYLYEKKGFPIKTSYYEVPESLLNKKKQLIEIASTAWKTSKQDKKNQQTAPITRIKDLPNLRLNTERMLKKAGIETIEELEEVGAARAFHKLRVLNRQNLNIELLWSLEGAINRIHSNVVTHARREELLVSLQGM